jgi:pimeloyl-ACP methyl ester carboxylesterase
LPVYAIWARDDQTIPIDALGQLAQWHRDAIHEVIDGAGHGVPYTHPSEVAEVLATLLDLSDE